MLKGQGMPDVRSGRRGSLTRAGQRGRAARPRAATSGELVEELDGALSATNYGEPPDEGFLGRLRRFGGPAESPEPALVRWTLRVPAADLEVALVQVLDAFPDGFSEEVRVGDVVVIAATCRRARRRRSRRCAEDVAVEPGWREAWRAFHRPGARSGPFWVGPPWIAPDAGRRRDRDRARRWRSAPARTARRGRRWSCSCATRRRGGALLDIGCGSGVLAIAAARLGHAPVTGVRPRSARGRRDARERRRQRRGAARRGRRDALAGRRAGRAAAARQPAAGAAGARCSRAACCGRRVIVSGLLERRGVRAAPATAPPTVRRPTAGRRCCSSASRPGARRCTHVFHFFLPDAEPASRGTVRALSATRTRSAWSACCACAPATRWRWPTRDGRIWTARVVGGGEVELLEARAEPRPAPALVVRLALTGPRSDTAIEKLVELGRRGHRAARDGRRQGRGAHRPLAAHRRGRRLPGEAAADPAHRPRRWPSPTRCARRDPALARGARRLARRRASPARRTRSCC